MDARLRGALEGIAANPASPPDVLLRLTALPTAAVGMAWRQPVLPDEVVERLLAVADSEIALALDQPGRSDATRRRVAEHPDAGIRDARRRFTEELVRTGGITLADLEEYAGPGGLVGLARHEDPKMRAAVAGTWEAMPPALRRLLLTDPDAQVRNAAAGHPHPPAPGDLHPRLLADPATRPKVASYALLTPRAIQTCLDDEDAQVRAALAVNPALPPQARDCLAEDPDPYVRSRVLLREDLPGERRWHLYHVLVRQREHDLDEVDIALSMFDHSRPDWLTSLPLAERLAYLDSPFPCFRREAARSGDLPPAVVRRLYTHQDIVVRRTVALRPDTPGEVLERIVWKHGEDAKHRPWLIEHPNFPPTAFNRLATGDESRLRFLGAHGPDLPAAVVVTLAGDDDATVRAQAARHPRVPLATLETLLVDEEPRVTEAAGSNPLLPAGLMRRLLGEAAL